MKFPISKTIRNLWTSNGYGTRVSTRRAGYSVGATLIWPAGCRSVSQKSVDASCCRMAAVPRWLVGHREACPGRVSSRAAGRHRVRRLRHRVGSSFTAPVLFHACPHGAGNTKLIYCSYQCTTNITKCPSSAVNQWRSVLPLCLVQRPFHLNGWMSARFEVLALNTIYCQFCYRGPAYVYVLAFCGKKRADVLCRPP